MSKYKHITLKDSRYRGGGANPAAILGEVFEVSCLSGEVEIVEACDYFNGMQMTKKDAIEMLKELIDYIEGCE